MKKIMFNDKYGLTDAVLKGSKTQTRRIITTDIYNLIDFKAYFDGEVDCAGEFENGWVDWRWVMPYRLGEEIAIAMSYEDVIASTDIAVDKWIEMVEQAHGGKDYRLIAGTDNKMFVKAELMPYRIKITDMWMHRLKEISDEDIMQEGIFTIPAETSTHVNGYGYTFDNWCYRGVRCSSDTPIGAYKALFDKVTRRGTFDSNPMVVAYKYELIRVF